MRSLSLVKIVLVLFTITLSSCSDKDERKIWWGFNGNVKTSTERVYNSMLKFNDVWSYTVEFDKKGLFIGAKTSVPFLNLETKSVPIRENGKIVAENLYENGELKSITTLNIISAKEFESETKDKNGKKTAYTKSVMEDGKRIMTTEEQDYTTVQELKNGNLISVKRIKEGEVDFYERYEYVEFDEHNNWIKKLTYKDNETEPDSVTIRKIEYY